MYYMITSRCNMRCAHCCHSCTSRGEDMTLDTFRRGIEWCGDEYLSIGGGEPTIHPHFGDILLHALGSVPVGNVWLATNGKVKDAALMLLHLAESRVVSVALSLDPYHEPIDSVVEQRYRDAASRARSMLLSNNHDHMPYVEIRDTSANLIRAGRCRDGKKRCPCEGLYLMPNGDVRACGCRSAPIFGNVNTTVKVPSTWDTSECYKKQPKEEV